MPRRAIWPAVHRSCRRGRWSSTSCPATGRSWRFPAASPCSRTGRWTSTTWTALARQLLAYSGRGSVARELVDLGQVIEQAAGLVAPAIARQVDLRYRLAGEVPRVEGDPTQLRQVAVNLITNAAEATGSGGGSVTAVVDMKEVDEQMMRSAYGTEALPSGRYACIEVTDTGPGIPEDVLPRIFDPFFTTKRAGRGLGLATVLGIVRAHGGAVQLETRVGQGTTFRVLLPVAAQAGNATSRGPG
ncbi:MAG: hypothetical protein HY905_06130 [Deltaproteobacteria bacterium]|nr:hypothetical protein [Deltaproteobacteria bacterium]